MQKLEAGQVRRGRVPGQMFAVEGHRSPGLPVLRDRGHPWRGRRKSFPERFPLTLT